MKKVTFQEWLRQYVQLMQRVRDGEAVDWELPQIEA